jgi:hypothetical protein
MQQHALPCGPLIVFQLDFYLFCFILRKYYSVVKAFFSMECCQSLSKNHFYQPEIAILEKTKMQQHGLP